MIQSWFTFPAVILTPLNPLQMTLYLSYPMTTIDRIEMVPKIPPVKAYTLHPFKINKTDTIQYKQSSGEISLKISDPKNYTLIIMKPQTKLIKLQVV